MSPSPVRGFFQLNQPKDLLPKLEVDLRRVSDTPSDPCPAFDFFVTAEHILDWLHPGEDGKPMRTAARQNEPLLQVVSHIATGAKHMVPEAKHHLSVTDAEAVGSVYGGEEYGKGAYGKGPLVIHLDQATAAKLGYSSITTLGFARHVLDYWKARPELK